MEIWRFQTAPYTITRTYVHANGLYGRKTFMLLPRFTAGLLLFSERNDGDVINLAPAWTFASYLGEEIMELSGF